jgi:hypothetical protein
MGKCILVYGKSGAGKTSSLRNFKEDEIFFINVEGKELPFRGGFKYTAALDDPATIIDQLNKMPCKTAVIDDSGYIMTHMFMRQHRNKKGSASFDMYDDIADSMYNLVKGIKALSPEKNVYIMMHEDIDDLGGTKLLTFGKLLDNKVNLPGMVTICLRAVTEQGKHLFRTTTDGTDITKAPMGMFEEETIDNDLKAVDDVIRNYYNTDNEEEKKHAETK